MWLILALFAALAFAVVHVMDAFCVEEIFEEPWIGVVTSAVASLFIFFLLPFLLPFVNLELPNTHIIFLALIAGALIQASQFFYFLSLRNTEAGIVAAYWNMIPAMLPLASFVLFGSTLTFFEYTGIMLLIGGSVVMCLLDSNLDVRWNSFALMLFASLIQVIAYLIEDHIFNKSSYLVIFLFISLGLIIAGLSPLLFRCVRKSLRKNYPKLHVARRVFILIEAINLLALALAQKAIDLGKPSLVAAAETTMPAFTFLISVNLAILAPRLMGPKIWHRIHLKLSIVTVMVFGVWLVS